MKNSIKLNYRESFLAFFLFLVVTISFTSCTDDLNKTPTNTRTENEQYSNVAGYKQSLVSIYSTMIYSDFLRSYWSLQEYTTDEAVATWLDDGGRIYHNFEWTASSPTILNVYKSTLITIANCNNYINESSKENLDRRGFSGEDVIKIGQFQAEARFLRAYCFWVLMDCYGNPPFPTEKSLKDSYPIQIQRKDLFVFIESELEAIESQLAEAKTNERGRPDKAATWALLSRLYLNAKIYTGEERFTDAITYCNKIINSGYSLETNYSWLMLGDNHLNINEFIFTLNYDNTNETWNGTNFLALGAAGVPATINGMSASWNSSRFTQQIPALFPSVDTSIDKRAQFYTQGQKLEINNLDLSTDGYSSSKYRNVTRDGVSLFQNNTSNNLSDIDFPVFRLAEIYLTYTESVLRGGTGGDRTTALSYINKIRGRAYANDPLSTAGNINDSQLTLDFILNERARELYWEAQRRTDLIRYNKLTTGTYLWAWKGGAKAGRAVDSKFNLFPIPTSDLLANPNLKQLDKF